MEKRNLFILFLSFFIQISCNVDDEELPPFSTDPCEEVTPTPENLRYKAVYDKPVIELPDNASFYSTETVEIKWSLPGDLWNTELQMIMSDEPYTCGDYEKFHQMNNEFSFGYGNQFVYYHTSTENFSPIKDSIYFSYRARATDIGRVQKYSKWTDVKSFIIVPLAQLNKEIVSVTYTLNFTTEEINHYYYSGVATVANYKLIDLAKEKNIDYDKIRFVKIKGLEGSFKTLTEEGDNPFSRLLIGFNEDVNPEETVYPFKVLGDISPGSFQESPVPGTGYENYTQNLVTDMNNYDLKVAYVLEDEVGSQHEIELHVTFEIYSEKSF